MRKRGKIVRMDQWETGRKAAKAEPRCEFKFRPSLHRKGDLYYVSLYKRSKNGQTFGEIKDSVFSVMKMALDTLKFLQSVVGSFDGWCIITTPRRRHFDGFHLATQVCKVISEILGIPFHEGAVQCINRHRIEPEFHNLRPIPERKVIIFDDIITTGSTLTATIESIGEREMTINIIGINNR